MKLNKYIAVRRKELGLTQKDLAASLNYTVQAISKYEKGLSSLNVSSLITIAKLLQVDVDSLLRCESKKNNDLADCFKFSSSILANNLAFLREKFNFTQKDVSRLLTVPYQSVLNWEKELSTPKTTALVSILKLYEMNAESLLFQSLRDQYYLEQRKVGHERLLTTY